MFVDNKLILQPIIDLLSSGTPLKAKEIAQILRKKLRIYELQGTDVNMILYGELRGVAEHDKNFYWSLRRGVNTKEQIISDPGQAESGRPMVTHPKTNEGNEISDRGSRLRTIERLRCGLPPLEHLDLLTAGPERNISIIRKFLEGNMKRRWLLIEGAYGHGKSHYLTLIRDLANAEGFATCHFSADGYGTALNHPQRFLPILLSTMVIPGRNNQGYVDLVQGMLQDQEQAKKLNEIICRYIGPDTRRRPEVEIRELVSALVYWLGRKNVEDGMAHVMQTSNRVAYLLSGESIRYRGATRDTRDMVYVLLSIARDVAMAGGGKGLTILVDEAESIFTKLHNSQSRMGAYRVLAQLCDSDEFRGCMIAIALTPDARRNLEFALPEIMAERRYTTEPVDLWALGLSKGEVETITCRLLKIEEKEKIMNRLLELYRKTYSNGTNLNINSKVWGTFVSRMISKEIPVRLLVRQAIDHLDCIRYYSSPQ